MAPTLFTKASAVAKFEKVYALRRRFSKTVQPLPSSSSRRAVSSALSAGVPLGRGRQLRLARSAFDMPATLAEGFADVAIAGEHDVPARRGEPRVALAPVGGVELAERLRVRPRAGDGVATEHVEVAGHAGRHV